MPETLVSALRRAAEIGRDDGGIRFVDRRENATWHPFPQIVERVATVAGALGELGIRKGDRVAIILPTGSSFTDSFFAVQSLGAVPVPLYPPVRLGRLDEYFHKTATMLAGVQARAVITEPRIRRLLGKITERYMPPLGVLDASTLDGPPHGGTQVSPDDLGLVQFSSGTTVAPKPVGLTHRQLLANASRVLDVVFEVTPQDQLPHPAGVSWLPLYHDMGLIGGIFPAILAPGPITLIPPEVFLAKPGIWLRTLSRYQGTISPAPNFAYALCVERVTDEELDGVDLSSWRMALNGAEPISASTLRAFTERFAGHGFRATSPMPVYGLSEAALAVTFSDAHGMFRAEHFDAEGLSQGRAVSVDDGVELVSAGKPLPDYAVRITDRDGEALPEGAIGEIRVKGPSLMKGYIDREEQPFDDEGWLRTGDLGFQLQGDLFVTGRAKDVIILRGRNHAPHDIERAVDDVEGVRRGCAAAVAEVGEHGERLLVFVEVRTPVEGQAESMERAIRSAVGITPDLVAILEPGTLPRTSSGKIRRAETLRRWQQGELAPPDSVTPWMLAGAFARSALATMRARWSRD